MTTLQYCLYEAVGRLEEGRTLDRSQCPHTCQFHAGRSTTWGKIPGNLRLYPPLLIDLRCRTYNIATSHNIYTQYIFESVGQQHQNMW
jgi:hypothetical protein